MAAGVVGNGAGGSALKTDVVLVLVVVESTGVSAAVGGAPGASVVEVSSVEGSGVDGVTVAVESGALAAGSTVPVLAADGSVVRNPLLS